MRMYPWAALDIDPTSDTRAIRKAYAVQLRKTRPDENPKGFQELVEARDEALSICHLYDPSSTFSQEWGGGLRQTEVDIPADEPVFDLSFNEIETPVSPGDTGENSEIAEDNETRQAHYDDIFGQIANEEPFTSDAFVSETMADDTSAKPEHDFRGKVLSPTQAMDLDDEGLDTNFGVSTVADVSEMLEALDRPSPFVSLSKRWALIFDAADNASIEDHFDIRQKITLRLVRDLLFHPFVTHSETLFPPKLTPEQSMSIVEMRKVLIDFERHFQVLSEDSILKEYVGLEDGFFLAEALSNACGRTSEPAPKFLSPQSLRGVPEIDIDFLEAAYRQDRNILVYYNDCRMEGRFLPAFSPIAFLFPLAWALFYRLTVWAWLTGALLVMMAGIVVFRFYGQRTDLDGVIPIVYFAIAVSCAVGHKRLRVLGLAQAIVDVQKQGGTHRRHVEKVHAAMHPSRIRGGLGFAVTAFCLAVAILFGIVLDPIVH